MGGWWGTAFLDCWGQDQIQVEDSFTMYYSVFPWACLNQMINEDMCWQSWRRKAWPLPLGSLSYLQITARQCRSPLASRLRSKHLWMTPHQSVPQPCKANGICLSSLHTLLSSCYLVNPCLYFRIQLRSHLFQGFFDPYCLTLTNWIRCFSWVLIVTACLLVFSH